MSRFVLVHGAWHGGWCWDQVRTQLEERGHQVETPDLPLDESLGVYVAEIKSVLESDDDPVILVGHSMAGAVIAQVAEDIPDRIERLVFLSAFVPVDGESILDKARVNVASVLRDNLKSLDDGRVVVDDRFVENAFYHDCDKDLTEAAVARLRPQNPAAFAVPVMLTADRFGAVDKQYIECIEDQAIHISLQRSMARDAGCTLVNSLQSSHSPFLSMPAALAALIATVGIKDARRG
jgi:pimeloyl-ACP methyl ester carboxylesterase